MSASIFTAINSMHLYNNRVVLYIVVHCVDIHTVLICCLSCVQDNRYIAAGNSHFLWLPPK